MSKLDVSESRAICAAATEGPWRLEDDGTMGGIVVHLPSGRPYRNDRLEDAEFIAHARQALPLALDRVEELERDLAAMTESRERHRAHVLAGWEKECEEMKAELNATWLRVTAAEAARYTALSRIAVLEALLDECRMWRDSAIGERTSYDLRLEAAIEAAKGTP
jgi:chromosome segregation ATPase